MAGGLLFHMFGSLPAVAHARCLQGVARGRCRVERGCSPSVRHSNRLSRLRETRRRARFAGSCRIGGKAGSRIRPGAVAQDGRYEPAGVRRSVWGITFPVVGNLR